MWNRNENFSNKEKILTSEKIKNLSQSNLTFQITVVDITLRTNLALATIKPKKRSLLKSHNSIRYRESWEMIMVTELIKLVNISKSLD